MEFTGRWWGCQSVLIDEHSELYQYLNQIQLCIKGSYKNLDIASHPLHIEICSRNANEANRKMAFDELTKMMIDVRNIGNYIKIGREFALTIGIINGQNRHITLAFGISDGQLEELKKLVCMFLIKN